MPAWCRSFDGRAVEMAAKLAALNVAGTRPHCPPHKPVVNGPLRRPVAIRRFRPSPPALLPAIAGRKKETFSTPAIPSLPLFR